MLLLRKGIHNQVSLVSQSAMERENLTDKPIFRFNVRRHQMLYCPHKQEIDPRLLGLGPQDCAKTAELEWKKKEMLKTGGKCIEVVDDEEEVEILEKLEEERTVRVNVNEDNDGIEFLVCIMILGTVRVISGNPSCTDARFIQRYP